MKKKGVLAIVLAVALVFQISAFSATGVFAGELSGDESIPAASPSIAMPAEEQEAATPTEETAPAPQETDPAAPIEKAEPAAPAEAPAAPEQEPAQTEQTPAPAEEQPSEAAQPVEDPAPVIQQEASAPAQEATPAAPTKAMQAAPAEETQLATPAANETITVNFHFYAYDTNAEYTVVKDVSRTVKSGGKTTNISSITANGYVTNKNFKTEEHNYEYTGAWAYDTAEGEAVTFPLSLTYEQAEARADGEASIDVNLYAQYKEYGLNTVVHITNILYNTGNSVNGKAVAYENTLSLSGKAGSKGISGFFSQVGGSNRTAGGFGAEYKFLNAFVLADEQSGPVYWETAADGPTVTKIAFKDYDNITVTLSNGETRTFDNCSDLYISPVYKRTVEWYLIYNYIDNISTGSGSWSNLDFVTSYSHTYTDPSVKTPVSHYQFVNWKNDETGDTYNAGETHTYDGATQPKESTKTISIYAYWQPSVTVNWHTPDGGLDKNAPNSGSIESFDPTTAIEAYSYTPANIQHEVTDEDGNVQTVTFTFDGWYDKDGNKVEETAGYTAPGITKEKVEQSIVDLYPHYTRAITVTKAWDDADNQDGLRTESVSVDLLAGEEVVGSEVLSEDNDWSYIFEDLAAFDENGKVIEYTAAESQIPEAYTASVSSAVADGVQTFTITNSHTPEVRDITISKVWNDNNDQYRQRPASVTIELLANGNAVERMQLTSDNGWSWVFRGLDKYNAGEEIVYTVREMAVPNYRGVVTGNAAEGFTVTNTST